MSEAPLLGLVEQTNDEYHAGPGISKSKLDAVSISALEYWDQYVNPDREPREEKHCFAVGDGTHKIILEPGTFEHTYAVDFDRSAFPNALDTADDMKRVLSEQMLMTNGTKVELARRLIEEANYPRNQIMMLLKQDHEASMAGKIAIPARDYKNMLGMLKAVKGHHTASGLLEGAYTEQSFYAEMPFEYIDHETGKVVQTTHLRKCRTDAISANGLVIPDLKTTEDVSEVGFGITIHKRRYHVQAAWYLDILRYLYGDDAPEVFCFIAVQKNRPHDVAVHILKEDDIQLGRLIYQRDLARLSNAMAKNHWPGVDGGKTIYAKIPHYAFRDMQEAQ